MFIDSADFVVGGVVAYIIIAAIVIFVGYLIIRTAILRVLNSHYITVRLFEKTGEWESRYQRTRTPRPFDAPDN